MAPPRHCVLRGAVECELESSPVAAECYIVNGWLKLNKVFCIKNKCNSFLELGRWIHVSSRNDAVLNEEPPISSVTPIKEKICSPKHGLIWSPDVVVRNMQRFKWLECSNLGLPWRSNIELQFPGRCYSQHHQLLYSTRVLELRTQDTGEKFVLSLTWSPTSFPQSSL